MATSLEGFFSHFNNADGNLATTLNPYNSCEVYFDFYPYKDDPSVLPNQVRRAGIPESCYSGFNPMRLNLSYYVQTTTVPNFTTINPQTAETWYIGRFPVNGNAVVPESTELTLDILNTRGPILERIFYPWLKEVTLPFWSYSTQPYTTATITLDLTRHTDLKYVFIGARPKFIQSFQPAADTPASMTRQVKFDFDFMFLIDHDGQGNFAGFDKSAKALPSVLFGSDSLPNSPVNLE